MLLSLTTWLQPESTSEALMLAYQQTGKKRYLTQLVDMHYDDLFHFLKSQSNHSTAQDIVQKSWLKVIEKKQLYQANGQFKSWLYTIARRLLIDDFRLQNRLTELDEKITQQISTLRCEEDNVMMKFDNALAALNFYQREAFILQQEGFSVSDIAAITHVEFETVKSRLRYAKQQLRNELAEFSDE